MMQNMNHEVFISYANADRSVADPLVERIEEAGVRCWIAPRDEVPGARYGDVIDEAVEHATVMVVLFSEYALESDWVNREVELAAALRKRIIPVRVDDVKLRGQMRLLLNNLHWIDMQADNEQGMQQIIRSVMRFLPGIQRKQLADVGHNPGDEVAITLPGGERMAFCWCPATTSKAWKKISGGRDYFLMGSPETEDGHYDNETLHRVTLTKGFWMGKYPVTEAQWNSVMGESSSSGVGSDHPVAWVSLDEFQEFMRKINVDGKVFVSLPTEAQWEFACRAGTTTPYNFGMTLNGDNANCNGNMPHGTASSGRYLGETSPVGSYLPNAWGIFDMHGNVWEGCSDWFGLYAGDAEDPTGPSQGECHVCRGGGWNSDARGCRSANRYSYRADFSGGGFLGFRLVCSAISHG